MKGRKEKEGKKGGRKWDRWSGKVDKDPLIKMGSSTPRPG